MGKYYYKLDEEKCLARYKENTGVDLFSNESYPLAITLVVEADSEEESQRIRIACTDITMWKLDKHEE